MLRIKSPFERCITCQGYHINNPDNKKNFIIVKFYLEYIQMLVKTQKGKTLHISARGLTNFPFEISENFVKFYVPAYIEYYRDKNYDRFEYLLDEFLSRIQFE